MVAIAPGLSRDFASKHWPLIGKEIWKQETKKAYLAIDYDVDLKIYASDISKKNLEAAMENAEEAGVDDCIVFTNSDFRDVEYTNDYGVIVSNPPYGERLSDENQVKRLYRDMGKIFNKLDTWSKYFFTSFDTFEEVYNKKADRQRKLYNGRIEARYYQYLGPRPPLKDKEN